MSQPIVEAVMSELTGSGVAFANDVGGRIYSLRGPINAALPICVVLPVATPVEQFFDDTADKVPEFQIDLYGESTGGEEVLGDINTKLFALLQNAELVVTGHDRGVVTCLDEGSYLDDDDHQTIRIISRWQVQATSTT